MEKNKTEFDEQEAPIKNTDNAFVQVGEDGKPQLPESEQKEGVETSPVSESNKEQQ